MPSWNDFRRLVEANDRVASIDLARRHGVPPGTWHTWRQRHLARRIAPGVWSLDEVPEPRTWLRGALEAVGPDAMLGRRSALWAWTGADPSSTARPLEVVTDHDTSHRRLGPVHLRRSRTLVDGDRTEVAGWPVTTVERTVLDLGASLHDTALRRVVIDLVFAGLTDATALVERAARTPTAWGARRVERVALPLVRERSDSIFEWLVRRAITDAGIPLRSGPQVLATEDGTWEVDLVVADARVAIECDGASHRTPGQQARDARKGNALSLDGWVLLRTTWGAFRAAPDDLVRQVARARARTRTRASAG